MKKRLGSVTTVKENKGVRKTQQSGIPSFPLADQVVQRGPFVYRNRKGFAIHRRLLEEGLRLFCEQITIPGSGGEKPNFREGVTFA